MDDREGFAAQYARAREVQFLAIADELLEIADDGSNDWMQRTSKDKSGGWELNGEHIQRSRVRIDTRKWILSKMLPKVYGDKAEVAVTGANGGPGQSLTVSTADQSKLRGRIRRSWGRRNRLNAFQCGGKPSRISIPRNSTSQVSSQVIANLA